jgi:membrane-associated phospholipid phosphatase
LNVDLNVELKVDLKVASTRVALVVALAGVAIASPARAERGELRYDLKVDGAITAAGFVFWGGSELLKGEIVPSTCRWCADNGFDAGARSALKWDDTYAAIVASNVGAFGVVPLATLGLTALGAHREGRLSEMLGNSLIVLESVALAGTLSQIVKFAAVRERPFVHALPAAEKPLTDTPTDNNVSFYSSHASFAFALAVSSGTVASMRGYRMAPCVWATGLIAAASVGYLRIAADKHYLTDVLVGATMGSAFGWAVPSLFHRGTPPVAIAPMTGDRRGLVLVARW